LQACISATVGWFIHWTIPIFSWSSLTSSLVVGGYGINPSEYASPSSSILFAPMVAATQRLGFGSAGPLDLIAAGGSVYLGSLFIERYVLGGAVTRATAWFAYPLGVLLIFALSAVALPMTGLEHSWHVLLLVVMLFEFARMLSTGGEASPFLIAAIVLAPLIRFEGVAASFAAILALAWLGRWKAALTAARASSCLRWRPMKPRCFISACRCCRARSRRNHR
jgi:hypothetical protein